MYEPRSWDKTERAALGLLWAMVVAEVAWGPAWIYTPAGIDPWFYHGYFLSLREHLRDFAGTYYGSRLGWLLPGFLAYHWLPALAANFVLRVAIFLTILTAGFALLRREYGVRCAVVCCLLVAANSYLLRAIGSDYIEAAVVAYAFVTLEETLASASAFAANRMVAGCGRALLAGISYAAAIHTNVFILVLAPAFAFSFLYRAGWKTAAWKAALAAITGAAICTIGLGAFSQWAGGPFWFVLPTIAHMQRQTGSTNSGHYPMSQWVSAAGWVVLPWGVTIASAYCLWRRRSESGRRTWRGHILAFWIAMAISWMLHALDQPVFQLGDYTGYSAPFLFAAAGAIIDRRLDHYPKAGFAVVAATAAGVAILAGTQCIGHSLSGDPTPHRPFLPTLPLPGAVPWYLTLVVAAMLAAELTKRRWAVVFPIAALCAWFIALTLAMKASMPDKDAARALFLSVHDAKLRLSRYSGNRRLYFWYHGNTVPAGRIQEDRYMSIASTYLYQYRLIGSALPDTSAFHLHSLPTRFRIALLAPESREIEAANAALGEAGVEVTPLAQWASAEPGYKVEVVEAVRRRLPEWYLVPPRQGAAGKDTRWVKDWSGAELSSACGLNFYGGIPERLPTGPRSAIFRVTTARDAAALPFVPVDDSTTELHLSVEAPKEAGGFGAERFQVNDQDFQVIYDSGTMPELKRDITLARPRHLKSVRVIFVPNDEGCIVLAARVKIGWPAETTVSPR